MTFTLNNVKEIYILCDSRAPIHDEKITSRACFISKSEKEKEKKKKTRKEEEKINVLWVYRHAPKSPQIASCGLSIDCGGSPDITHRWKLNTIMFQLSSNFCKTSGVLPLSVCYFGEPA